MPAASLLLAFTVKHYVADFVLQTNWIARGKESAKGWIMPLAAHSAVHGAMTLAIVVLVLPRLWWLSLVDGCVHFVIDRGKSLVGRWGGWTAHDARYWWLLGLDQLLHQVTNIALSVCLLVL